MTKNNLVEAMKLLTDANVELAKENKALLKLLRSTLYTVDGYIHMQSHSREDVDYILKCIVEKLDEQDKQTKDEE